jgi:hypothetical protein
MAGGGGEEGTKNVSSRNSIVGNLHPSPPNVFHILSLEENWKEIIQG